MRTCGNVVHAFPGLLQAVAGVMLFLVSSGTALAMPCDTVVVYDGQGAGQVVFDGKLHAEKGLTCAVCHEGGLFSPALFSMKKGSNDMSMRKMELGRSCGYCHPVSMTETLVCDKCHKK